MSSIIARRLERASYQVQEGIHRIGALLYARSDANAARQGWTVIERWGGLARTYRDSRFDQFRRCHRCHGTGMNNHARSGSCFLCWGTGRLIDDPDPVHQRAS